MNKDIRKAVISGYRNTIRQRYQFYQLEAKYDLPDSFTAERIDKLRDFFLEYVYPEYEKRKELDAAFHRLDAHLKHPEQLLRILIDSGRLIFTYGRHLPKVLKAGLKALKSFREASIFEDHLQQIAEKSKATPPFDEERMKEFLGKLSPDEIDHFIKDNLALFDTLYDRKLVAKIIDIVDFLIKIMRQHPKTYGPEELKGLEWGREIITKGDQLFNELSKEEQQVLFEWAQKIELDFIQQISKQ